MSQSADIRANQRASPPKRMVRSSLFIDLRSISVAATAATPDEW